MADATGTSAQVRLVGVPAGAGAADEAEFSASGTVIGFAGFLRAYVEGSDDEAETTERDVQLPALVEGDTLSAQELEARSHTTQPPARYTEASLVKALEELGVGRPSTYASILGTIQNRGYVWKKGTALVPSFTAFAVVGLLERYFGDLVDYGFTAAMENDLDEIADGEREVLPWLTRFYFGGQRIERATRPRVTGASKRTWRRTWARSTPARSTRFPSGPTPTGEAIVVRVGRYGPYLQRGDDRASIPEDLPPDELTVERAEELLAAPSGDRTLGTDPDGGSAGARPLGPLRSLHPARRGCRRRRAAPHGVALQVHDPRDRDPGRRRSSCSASPGRSAPTRRRARRSRLSTAASGRT